MCMSLKRLYLKDKNFCNVSCLLQIHTFVVNQNMLPIYVSRFSFYSEKLGSARIKLLTGAAAWKGFISFVHSNHEAL